MPSTKAVEVRLGIQQQDDGMYQFEIIGQRLDGNESPNEQFYLTTPNAFSDQAYARIQGAMNSAIQMALNDLQRQFAAEKLKQHNDMKGQDK